MTQEEVKTLVEETVAEAVEPILKQLEELAKAGEDPKEQDKKDGIREMTDKKEREDIAKMVSDVVAKAVGPMQYQLDILKHSRALPSSLNGEPSSGLFAKGSGEHYLHGIL